MRQEGQGTLELLLLLMVLAVATGLLVTFMPHIDLMGNEEENEIIYAPPMPENEAENNGDDTGDGVDLECVPGDMKDCGLGIGICTGSQICADGTWNECNAPSPADEICNDGLDNDCDWQTDEGCICNIGEEKDCGSDIGGCVKGKQTCEDGKWGNCTGAIRPADEICDNLDNDCDGLIDEECLCSTGEKKDCGSDVGECAKGTQTCENGVWGNCIGATGPATEICDNLDNDCDGYTDEGCLCSNEETRECGSGIGECAKGMQTCENGAWGGCIGSVTSTAEICDTLDNDCDGDVDEGCECETGEKKDCGFDTGECVKGKQTCEDGKWGNCVGVIGPVTESCDNLDNDCDGYTDEGCLCSNEETRECGSGIGECAKGMQTCENGKWGNCVGAIGPVIEICDNLDNDCDGYTDESLTKQCGSNVGICKYGISSCSNGIWGNCSGGVNPTAETCDNLDNDCDWQTDEGCLCSTGEKKDCGSDAGECSKGSQTCENGVWGNCIGATGPATEICDNLDNDCDGYTDEGCLCSNEETRECGSGIGECAKGMQTCENGKWGNCVGAIGPVIEICDNLDNDCDGYTDESLTKQCGSNVGICKYGTSTCSKGAWGNCIGGVNPAVEICDDGKDNDCDGSTDEECTENPENNLAVVWFSNAMKKILKMQAAEKSNIAKISAAKNEYESFQIVVSSKVAASKNFTVSVSNFSGIIDAYKEEYVDTGYVPNWGIDPSELIYSGEKLMPDPLVPISLGSNQIPLKGKENQPMWFTVYVPKNSPAGTYPVMIKITFDSGEIITKKVTLEVYDFALPDEFALRSLFGLGSVRYHFKSPSFTDDYADAYNKMVKKYYKEFRKNRLNPFLYDGAFSPMIANRNTYFRYLNISYNGETTSNSINYSYFENAAQQNLAQFNTFIFTTDKVDNKTYFPKYGTSEEESSFKFFFTQVRNYLKNKGWYTKAIHYLWDEPNANEISTVKKYAEWIKDTSVAPDLPTAITLVPGTWGWASITCPSSNLYDGKTADFFEKMFTLNDQKKLIDIWIPLANTLNSETKQLFKNMPSNETLWTYDISVFSVITRRVLFKKETYSWYSLEGKEGVANRIWPWLTWKFGGTGIVYYSVNAYECQNNPWKNPTHVCGGIPLEEGTGAFFYPPCKESATGSCAGIRDDTTIIPSERWELLREGIEDYEYFNLLQKKINAGKDVSGKGKLALDNAMALLQNDCWYTFDIDPAKYYAARDAVAKAISSANE